MLALGAVFAFPGLAAAQGPATATGGWVGPFAVIAAGIGMALAAGLTKACHSPTRISTNASVSLEKVGEGFKITTIELTTEAEIPNIEEAAFLEQAETAKKNCPVSQALAGTDIKLNAKLLKG